MLSTDKRPGNFRRRPQNRKMGSGTGRRKAPWRKASCPTLNRAIILSWLIALTFATEDDLLHHRDWSRLGLTADVLFKRVVQVMPGLPRYFNDLMGEDLAPRRLHNRLYVCYWKANQRGPRAVYSNEHPMNHPVLKPQIDLVRELFSSGMYVPVGMS